MDGNRLPLTRLRAANELRVVADMPYSRTGAGLHRFTDDADDETYLALHGGLDNAQRVFAAFDQPDMKAVHRATVKAPGHWTVSPRLIGKHLVLDGPAVARSGMCSRDVRSSRAICCGRQGLIGSAGLTSRRSRTGWPPNAGASSVTITPSGAGR